MLKYGVFSGPNTGKYGPEETQYLDTFQAVFRAEFAFLKRILILRKEMLRLKT